VAVPDTVTVCIPVVDAVDSVAVALDVTTPLLGNVTAVVEDDLYCLYPGAVVTVTKNGEGEVPPARLTSARTDPHA
jgi:hypothetical protein